MFDETKLSKKEDFYSLLRDKHVSDEDNGHAKTVCSKFEMNTLGGYHD